MTAREFFQQGRLQEAIAAATDDVRKRPAEATPRIFLGELLCFTADLEKADRQLDVVAHQDPESALGVATFRQLVRAEQARRDFFERGRVPEFLGPPSECLRLLLEASILVREGDLAGASGRLAESEGLRAKVSGTCDGQAFQDLRDLDDLTAPVFEVLTSDGRYLWAPIESVATLEFQAPARPLDLLWRRAVLTVHDGPEGEVFVPALYSGSYAEADDPLRLGRLTDWRGGENSPVRGAGQRMFLVGEDAIPILEIKTISIAAAAPVA